MTLTPEELAEIDDLTADLERSYDEFEDLEAFGFGGVELLDASGLGNGGFGVRLELDFNAMFDAFADDLWLDDADLQVEEIQELPYMAGIGVEAYFFYNDTQVLATMVMWPLDRKPSFDALSLAQIMDARAAAFE